jgi:hypothetical protein
MAISFDGLNSLANRGSWEPGTANDEMADQPRKAPYRTSIGGLEVRCATPEDAAAIEKAANILAGSDQKRYPPQEIERLAMVLTQYGRGRAARVLRHRSTLS